MRAKTRRLMLTTAAMIGLLCFANAAMAARLKLAEEGKALVPVVIAEEASPELREVAAELADYLLRISGATFIVKTGDGAQGIVLGTLEQFPDQALEKPLEIRQTYDGREAFAIRTEAGRLRLIGATDLGASHAAYRLLEVLGVRRFFPAKEWEVVPNIASLVVDHNESDRPVVLSRRIWYGFGFFEHDKQQGCLADYNAWTRHNRMAASLKVYAGHAWQGIILKNQQAFDEHPEYYALVKGKRQGPQMCVSNPAVRKMAHTWAINHFQRNPEADMVSLETSDGYGHCECEACLKMGSVSDRAFGLANEVARALQKSHPGKMVGMLAYSDHCEPPSFDLEPNVYVESTHGFITGKYTFDELMELWPQRSRMMGFYDYFSVWYWDFDMPPGGRGGNVSYLREQIPRFVNHGAKSLTAESGCNWGIHGRGYLVASRLMWNPNVDVEAVLADFYEKAFGPAADMMNRYYDRLDAGRKPIISEHLLAMALRDLGAAAETARDRPDVIARIDHLKQYLHYVRLRWEYDRARGDLDRQQELALAALTHAYRTRHSYMTHWGAMRQAWTREAAKKFDQPDWAFNSKSPDIPWKIETTYTHEETEARFEEDLTRFVPDPVEERHFSDKLVPSGLQSSRPGPTRHQYQRGMRYALYSRTGEPVRVTIVTGVIAHYRNRADSLYTLTDDAGRQIASERLPLDGEEHAIEIEVPSAGLYWFDFQDYGAGWRILAEPGQAVSIQLKRDVRIIHLGHIPPVYFYVPKGTQEIQYFWNGQPHRVHTPDGKLHKEVTASGKFIKIPVPDGTDGAAWSMSRLALGHLWFFNVPNYVAASPEALLLPSEIVKKDGLLAP